ncbi:probable protein phosphatase 2C 71 isoform X2 [Tripterygium wilfordii]|uniref:probable protein phosphatase 2C 71 isoform X2 n=1 Tax=Tripterygium wilfordii TaxID=458696 RepID=UPI0018F80490|nr:probable protein phosphatase 2C 71 isoform X2 [Tripterygium wilfordii]
MALVWLGSGLLRSGYEMEPFDQILHYVITNLILVLPAGRLLSDHSLHRMADPLFIFQRPFTINTFVFASFPFNSYPRQRRRPLRFLSVRNNHTSPPDVPRIDVISTTELSDGSVLFRFGDASEMAKEKVVEDKKNNNSVADNHRARRSEKLSRDNVGVVDDRGTSEHCDSGKAISTTLEVKLEAENSYVTLHGGKESMKKEDMRPSVATMEDGDAGNVIVEIPESDSVHSVDVIVETDRVESSKKIDDNVALASSSLDEITEGNANSSSTKADASILNAAELPTTRADVSREEENFTATLFLSSGAASLRHSSEALTGGEDAYFVTHHNWLGIADGAGQWSLEGINVAGLFTHELMKNCEKIVTDDDNISINDPVEALMKSVAVTEAPGSSTALIAFFNGQVLHVANIGDTGFIIVRNGTVVKRSSPIHHEFNFPVRIESGDDPSAVVEEYKINLDEGDIIVTATDGLFDNLYEQEIASIVLRSLKICLKPQEIAEFLAAGAQEVGRSASVRSPFADAAQAAGYAGYRGGKLDNVTVIVSLVQKKSDSHLQQKLLHFFKEDYLGEFLG